MNLTTHYTLSHFTYIYVFCSFIHQGTEGKEFFFKIQNSCPDKMWSINNNEHLSLGCIASI